MSAIKSPLHPLTILPIAYAASTWSSARREEAKRKLMRNTIRYVKQLEEVGYTREQAEAYVQVVSEMVQNDVATKQDINDLRSEMTTRQDVQDLRSDMATRQDVQDLRSDMATRQDVQDLRSDMATKRELFELRADLKQEIQRLDFKVDALEQRLVIKLGALMAAMFTIFALFVKLG